MSKSKVAAKRLRNELIKKLEEAGLSDKSIMVPNGAYGLVPALDEKGQQIRQGDKLQFFKVPKFTAHNTKKSLIKRLMAQGPEVVRAFMRNDLTVFAKQQEQAQAEYDRIQRETQAAVTASVRSVDPYATKLTERDKKDLMAMMSSPNPGNETVAEEGNSATPESKPGSAE